MFSVVFNLALFFFNIWQDLLKFCHEISIKYLHRKSSLFGCLCCKLKENQNDQHPASDDKNVSTYPSTMLPAKKKSQFYTSIIGAANFRFKNHSLYLVYLNIIIIRQIDTTLLSLHSTGIQQGSAV